MTCSMTSLCRCTGKCRIGRRSKFLFASCQMCMSMIVDSNIFGNMNTSLAYRCLHKNCLVCVGCAKKLLEKEINICFACKSAMPLADRKFAVQRAKALTKSMLNLLGPVGSQRAPEERGQRWRNGGGGAWGGRPRRGHARFGGDHKWDGPRGCARVSC